jgi:quercetin dioxygenase-like cupin family protein
MSFRAPDLSPHRTMHLHDIPFGITDWSSLEASEHPGETGVARWRTCQFGAVRVRMVDYSAGYRADHWCEKGHILLCLRGELETELRDGRTFRLVPGTSYQVADHAEAHRSSSAEGATLFIVD